MIVILKKALLPTLCLVVGLAVGSYLTFLSDEATIKPLVVTKTIPQEAIVEKNPYNTEVLTLPEMLSNLRQADSTEYDHRLLVYSIALKQYEIGMMRQADNKSIKADMQQYALSTIKQNEHSVVNLLAWQKEWGFLHH